MPLVVDATPLGASTNSYISVAGADSYVADRVTLAATVTAWAALSAEQKGEFLVRASEMLDSMVSWFGDRYSQGQKLKWPRINVLIDGFYLNIGTIFPLPVTYACVELALFIMAQSGEVFEENENVLYDAVTVGPLKIDYNTVGTGTFEKFFPEIVAILLKDYGSIENPDLPNTNRVKQVHLQRA